MPQFTIWGCNINWYSNFGKTGWRMPNFSLLINVFANVYMIYLCKLSVATIKSSPSVPNLKPFQLQNFNCYLPVPSVTSIPLEAFKCNTSVPSLPSQAFLYNISVTTVCCNLLLTTFPLVLTFPFQSAFNSLNI